MSDVVSYGMLKRISWLPNRDAAENGTVIAGQEYDDIEVIGGSISNVILTDVTINGVDTIRNETIVTASGGYAIQPPDYVITVNKTVPEITTVTLPNLPTTSQSYIIKDGAGNAGSFNITLDGNGQTIDGQTTQILNSDYEAAEIIFNGTEWNIIGEVRAINAVEGPGVSFDNAIARFNGITGQVIQNTPATISDTGVVAGLSIDTAAALNILKVNGTSLTAIGDLTDIGTDGIVITNGPGAVIGSGTSIAQHVADTTHNGYLSSADWNAFNGKSVVTPAALSKVNDTNVTLTLGGTPLTALLQSTSLTLGWTGTLSAARGGTGVANTGSLTYSGAASITGSNTGDQTITLTGAVTGAGTGSFATTIATPGTLTVASTNSTVTAHTHAITSSSAPGAAASILATDASGIIGSTGTRLVKGWFADLTVTNAIAGSVTGAAGSVAVGGITGLGTGVGAALAVNVGTAGSPVVNGGALGVPSSGVATNLTGTAAGLTAGTVTTNANLTGIITSSGNATSFGSFTSAQILAGCSDKTGTGAMLFATGGTINQPNIVGVTNGSLAAAGSVGEILTARTAPPTSTATVTITIASPGVITWTGHGLTATNAVVFTNSGGALPTGIVSGTTYYVTAGASITTNTFQISTTVANALAGTSVNTSGSQSGTQTGTSGVALATATPADLCGLSLTAGEWLTYGVILTSTGGTTTTTLTAVWVSTTSVTVPTPLDNSGGINQVQCTAPAGANQIINSGIKQINVSGTTNLFLTGDSTFSISTSKAYGFLAAIRIR